ncbi:MAG TPA: endonuclease/exonuclease/phosphatase family protein [Solirubrobacteraceae bacterium]|nr:endonuclease/exonuclease/phosphatase family protein [Solirubrobacteraceae bacterium]
MNAQHATARLLTWNVAGKVQRLVAQAAHVIDQEPDLVCLQEVTVRTAPQWTSLLASAGLTHTVVADPRDAVAAARTRPLLTLTAARMPQEPVAVTAAPWPERVLATRVTGAEVVNVHSPISPKPGLAKVMTHEAVHAHVASGAGPRLVCGDLNTPRKEHPDGRVWTFARDRSGRLVPERGPRWDEAELALVKGLEQYGFRDAFREVHGLERREFSWEWPRTGGGYRLDHLIVSAEIAVSECRYLHQWRRAGLSDHSPLLADISWPAG